MAQRQASVLLLTNADQMAEHWFDMDRLMSDAHQGALLAPRERDSFSLEELPLPLAMGDLNPGYSGLVFPGSEPDKPDLSSLILDSTIPMEVRERIHLAVEMSHQENVKRVKALDQKFRGLYTVASGLVNNSMEAVRGFGKVAAALDIRQQVIVRRSGPFIKPTPRQKAASSSNLGPNRFLPVLSLRRRAPIRRRGVGARAGKPKGYLPTQRPLQTRQPQHQGLPLLPG